MSATREDMTERLKIPQAIESLNLERIITAQVDDCRRMSMLSALLGDPSIYWQAVQTLKTLMGTIADEELLKDLKAIDDEMEVAQKKMSKLIDERPYERFSLDLEFYANKYFSAAMRRLQRMGLGLTLIGEDETFQ